MFCRQRQTPKGISFGIARVFRGPASGLISNGFLQDFWEAMRH
jgi:hypothetical protein